MAQRRFFVQARRDDAAGIFVVARSDIRGLHIEAATREEFETVLRDIGPELIIANHMRGPLTGEIADLIPTIVWQDPCKPGQPYPEKGDETC